MKERVLRKREREREKKHATSSQTHTDICKKKITGKCCICENKICGDCGVACKEDTCFLVYCLKHLDQLDRCDHFLPEIKEEEEKEDKKEDEKSVDLSCASKSENKKEIININDETPVKEYFSNLSGSLTLIGNITIDKDGKIGTDLEFKIKKNGNDLEISQIGCESHQNFSSIVTNSFGGFNQVNRFFGSKNNSLMCINGMNITQEDLNKLRDIKNGVHLTSSSNKKEENKKDKTAKKIFYIKDCKFKKIFSSNVGNIFIFKSFISDNLEIFSKGEGSINLSDKSFKCINVHVSGSGSVNISNSVVSHMECKLHGSGDIIGDNTFVDDFLCSLYGSGDIKSFVVGSHVTASLYGSGDISLRKKNQSVTVNKQKYGSGSVRIK